MSGPGCGMKGGNIVSPNMGLTQFSPKVDLLGFSRLQENAYPKLPCVDRQCGDCGTNLLANILQPFEFANKDVTWHIWEYRESERTKQKRRVLVKKTTSTRELTTHLKADLEPFTIHLFHAQWQHHQYNKISTIPNFSCFYQEEIHQPIGRRMW